MQMAFRSTENAETFTGSSRWMGFSTFLLVQPPVQRHAFGNKVSSWVGSSLHLLWCFLLHTSVPLRPGDGGVCVCAVLTADIWFHDLYFFFLIIYARGGGHNALSWAFKFLSIKELITLTLLVIAKTNRARSRGIQGRYKRSWWGLPVLPTTC